MFTQEEKQTKSQLDICKLSFGWQMTKNIIGMIQVEQITSMDFGKVGGLKVHS